MNMLAGWKRSLLKVALFSGMVVLAGNQQVLAGGAGIDPSASKLLRNATDFMAAQRSFSVRAESDIEVVLHSGQKIQFLQSSRLMVQRPDKFRAERYGDYLDQVMYYDGKTISLHNPQQGVYATVPMAGTLERMFDYARENLGILAPGGDLIYTNAYELLLENVTSGMVVGKSMIEGVRCDHLAFSGAETDWQIWIQEGDTPLPRKLVITSRDVMSQPQFSVTTHDWNLVPQFDQHTFQFEPSEGIERIEFLTESKQADGKW